MIITVAAATLSLGFIGWILGTIFNYPSVAVIGAVIIVGVGAMAMSNGLEYKTGEIEMESGNTTSNSTIEHGEVNNTTVQTGENQTETVNSTVTTINQYEELDTPTNLPLGALITLLGGVLVLRSLDSFSDA